MKKYYFGTIEIRNVEILKSELNKNEKFECVGIQRSLSHLYEHSNECISSIIYGDGRYINNEDTVEMNGEFELPLLDNMNNLVGIVEITGIGTEIIDEEDDIIEEYLIIEKVSIIQV